MLLLLNVSTRGYILIYPREHTHTLGDISGMEILMAFKTSLQPYEMWLAWGQSRNIETGCGHLNDRLKWGRGLLQRHIPVLEGSQVFV